MFLTTRCRGSSPNESDFIPTSLGFQSHSLNHSDARRDTSRRCSHHDAHLSKPAARRAFDAVPVLAQPRARRRSWRVCQRCKRGCNERRRSQGNSATERESTLFRSLRSSAVNRSLPGGYGVPPTRVGERSVGCGGLSARSFRAARRLSRWSLFSRARGDCSCARKRSGVGLRSRSPHGRGGSGKEAFHFLGWVFHPSRARDDKHGSTSG